MRLSTLLRFATEIKEIGMQKAKHPYTFWHKGSNAQTTIINNIPSNERTLGKGIIIGHCMIAKTTNQIIKDFLLTIPHLYNS